jgi:hypothetical protein
MRKAQRLAETQELRGQTISAPTIVLQTDYKQEQKVIHSSNVDLDIFNQEIQENQIYDLSLQELDVGWKTIQLATILA